MLIKRKNIDENEKEVIYLEIEKSKINREKSKLVLNKSLMLYFSFLFIGVIGFSFDYINSFMLNVLVVLGIIILVIGSLPYLIITHNEEKKIESYLAKLRK